MTLVIKEHVSLKDYTTLKTGGVARYVVEVRTEAEMHEAAAFIEEKALPYLILGGGSNMLVFDAGFAGVVVHILCSGQLYEPRPDGTVLVTAGAGEVLDAVVKESVSRGLWGLENLSAIPGSVGATPVQNVGAYGVEVKDLVVSVRAYHLPTKTVRQFSVAECQFGYRDSFFKTSEGKSYVILSVQFLLRTCVQLKIEYADLKNYFASHTKEILVSDVRDAVMHIRSKKFPDWHVLGTAGSFFKNPIISATEAKALQEKFPALPVYPVTETTVKVSLGYILDKACNLKGFRLGAVGLYEAQALVLVNYGDATATEILSFVELVTKKVYEVTGIVIEPEVRFVGDES